MAACSSDGLLPQHIRGGNWGCQISADGWTKVALTEAVELKHANHAGIDVQAEEGWEARVIHSLFEELQGLLSDLFQLCSRAQSSSSLHAAPAALGLALTAWGRAA